MKTACPSCGAEVEFRYDDSFVRICGHCRQAVVRTDRGAETLGKVADLAPSSSPLELWLEGRLPAGDGRGLGFLIVGHAQLRHGAGGVWDEWYAKFDDGRWGWIAESMGRFHVTFEAAGAGAVPGFDAIAPGDTVVLEDEGARRYTVGEKGVGEYLACDGEIPYRFVPGGRFRFADLGEASGRFGTIDYGAPDEERAPTIYLGRQVTLAELGWAKREAAARAAPAIASTGADCPECGGDVTVRSPETQRLTCPYCGAVLDVSAGRFALIAGAKRAAATPLFPLGAAATFEGVTYTLIAFLRRNALIDGAAYPFDEYLLYAPKVGYRWLVHSDGHWSFVTTLPTGAAQQVDAHHARYRGVRFRLFSTYPIEVAAVLGEVYWKVAVGETVHGSDYIAPPAMLSREQAPDEQTWSLGVHLEPRQVAAAFGAAAEQVTLPAPIGVAPNQPYRHRALTTLTGLGLLGALAIALVLLLTADRRLVHEERIPIELAPASTADAPGAVHFSAPFQLAGGENVEITLDAPALTDNAWLAVGGDLINEQTGVFDAFDVELAFWTGYDDGYWSEDERRQEILLGALEPGTYVVRLEVVGGRGPTGAYTGREELQLQVRQDVFRPVHLLIVLVVIGVPGLGFVLWHFWFERRRWRDSDVAPMLLRSSGDDD